MNVIISEIEAAKYLLGWEKRLGHVRKWKQTTLDVWFIKYNKRRERLVHDLSIISDDDCDDTISRDAIQSVIDRLDECRRTYEGYKDGKKDKTSRKDKCNIEEDKPSPEDIIRERLYESIREDVRDLRYLSIDNVKMKIGKLERLLANTTDITQRQMIKEGLNDFHAYLDNCIKEQRRREKILEDSAYMLSLYNMDDYEKGIYARANFSMSYSNRVRTADGDVMMFFGNGDVVVL